VVSESHRTGPSICIAACFRFCDARQFGDAGQFTSRDKIENAAHSEQRRKSRNSCVGLHCSKRASRTFPILAYFGIFLTVAEPPAGKLDSINLYQSRITLILSIRSPINSLFSPDSFLLEQPIHACAPLTLKYLLRESLC